MFFISKCVGEKCYDRGDLDTIDFDKEDIETDDTWHDLDLSSIVGVRIARIDMRCEIQAAEITSEIRLRQKGITNDINISYRRAIASAYPVRDDITVLTNSAGIIQYKLPIGLWTYINLTVKRYIA